MMMKIDRNSYKKAFENKKQKKQSIFVIEGCKK